MRAELNAAAERLGVSVVQGKHWTTDAIFRETIGKVARLASAGVVSVDMELSALAGVAHFMHANWRRCTW
jgi:uridine phosphorylase